MNMSVRPGDVVPVYEDPITCEKLEGKLKVNKILSVHHDSVRVRGVFVYDSRGNPTHNTTEFSVERLITTGCET